MPTGWERSGTVVAFLASLRLGEKKPPDEESHWRGHRLRSNSAEPIKSKDGITQIVNGLEEDDHAKSPGRKEVWGIPQHPLLGISRAQPLAIIRSLATSERDRIAQTSEVLA